MEKCVQNTEKILRLCQHSRLGSRIATPSAIGAVIVHSDATECKTKLSLQQELSYRKQIAHKLRTQYVEGIYDNPLTLKSTCRLTVTQDHWKQNHRVDHTRLTIRRVIGR